MVNVTVDPQSYATPVTNPEIQIILDCETGESIEANEFIRTKLYSDLVQVRSEIKEKLSDKPLYKCAYCRTSVSLVSSTQKRFFFRHTKDAELCPAKTKSKFTQEQIRAFKYRGQKEGAAHKRIKKLIERSLAADTSVRNIKVEERYYSALDDNAWRQPDVRAMTSLGMAAFEAQLSTTFLDVVVGRKQFYRKQNIILIWVLAKFDPNYRRLMEDDLFFTNNRNVFIVDDETVALSEENKEFFLRCYYQVLRKEGRKIYADWKSELVRFKDLKVNIQKQEIWYFDFEKHKKDIVESFNNGLSEDFIIYWFKKVQFSPTGPEATKEWENFVERFSEYGIDLSYERNKMRSINCLMNMILSLREKRPIGWQFKKLIQVVHKICEGYPEHIVTMGFAIKFFELEELLQNQDRSGKWKKQREKFSQCSVAENIKYRIDEQTLPFLKFVFPDIGKKVEKYLLKGKSALSP